MSEASQAAGAATDWRVWPAQWVVVVPANWTALVCRTAFLPARGGSRYLGSGDLVVEPGPSLGTARPLALQTGGCGAAGRHIALSAPWLLQQGANNTARAELLAREFFKLRFGVFDERGWEGDPVYPAHYTTASRVLPTGVLEPGPGSWRDPAGRPCPASQLEGCTWRGAGQGTDCPLGLCQLPGPGPTKQRAQCGPRSAREVVEASPDLVGAVGGRPAATQPEILTVQAATPRWVLVLDTTAGMADTWRWVHKALQKLLRYDLQPAALAAVVTFAQSARLEAGLTRVGAHRAALADTVPDKFRLSRSAGRGCGMCGLRAGLAALGEDKAGGQLVLVGRSGLQFNQGEIRELRQAAQYYQITFHSILLADNSSSPAAAVHGELAALTGGRADRVSGRGVHLYRALSRALAAIIGTGERVLHEAEVGPGPGSTTGQFLVEAGDGLAQFGVFVEAAEEHQLRSVTFTNTDSGAQLGPYGFSSRHDLINLKAVRGGPDGARPSLGPATWHYSLAWEGAAGPGAAVVVTAGPGTQPRFTLQMWTSASSGTDIATASHPLSLHVAVAGPGGPVLRARVIVTPWVTSAAGTVTTGEPLRLWDGGNGAADITGDDGVYSRLLVRYPGPGRYRFHVSVDDNNGSAVVAGENDFSAVECCGSRTGARVETASRTGRFQSWLVGAGAVELIQVPGRSALLPPGRVGDLVAATRPASRDLLLSFTAPGADHDLGRVAGYAVLASPDPARLGPDWGQVELLARVPASQPAYARESVRVNFPRLNQEFYLAVVGVDWDNNTGAVSNLVEVVMAAGSGAGGSAVLDTTDSAAEITDRQAENEWKMILALCGSFLLLAICLLCGILYFLKCAKPKKPIMIDIGVSDDVTDTGSCCSSEIRNISSDQLVLSAAALPRPPPASLPADSPSYWSASQLLAEHEQRALSATYASLSRSLTPIKEEYLGHFTEWPPGEDNAGYAVTPHHPVPAPRRLLAAEAEWEQESVVSVGSFLYREEEPDPARFSQAVQTVAPSSLATIRQTSELAQRQASLV